MFGGIAAPVGPARRRIRPVIRCQRRVNEVRQQQESVDPKHNALLLSHRQKIKDSTSK